jgi:acyl-coenzyme A synthetase/AMP-(fatty) acid ligase
MSLQSTEHLWPNAIRSRVAETRPYARVVNVNGQVQDVTFADLENASNRAARFLVQNCPHDTFVYMGPSDLRYMIWAVGAMKAGKCVSVSVT